MWLLHVNDYLVLDGSRPDLLFVALAVLFLTVVAESQTTVSKWRNILVRNDKLDRQLQLVKPELRTQTSIYLRHMLPKSHTWKLSHLRKNKSRKTRRAETSFEFEPLCYFSVSSLLRSCYQFTFYRIKRRIVELSCRECFLCYDF